MAQSNAQVVDSSQTPVQQRATVAFLRAEDLDRPKPRTPRAKAAPTIPVNQAGPQGFVQRPAKMPSSPIAGSSPSVLREEDRNLAATISPPTVTKATTSPTLAKEPASPWAALAHVPGAVVASLVWTKNMVLGSAMAFSERAPEVLSPVAFLFANMITILLALAYCATPAIMGLLLISHYHAVHEAIVVNGPMKVIYMVLLYVGCAFIAMLGAFALRALALGIARTLNTFASKGQSVFHESK